MSKAVCSECQYMYDSRVGIPEQGVAPGSPFWMIDDSEFLCPHCWASKDIFIEVEDPVVEVEDPEDLNELESEHVPMYRFSDDTLEVWIGDGDSEHPQEAVHRIECIDLRDSDGNIVDRVYFSEWETPKANFSIDEEEDFQITATCSEHGTWKGIRYVD